MIAEPADRVRQAAIGCTVHSHGPLNALAMVVEGHAQGTLDGHATLAKVIEACDSHLASLEPDSVDAKRERKVRAVIACVDRGLLP